MDMKKVYLRLLLRCFALVGTVLFLVYGMPLLFRWFAPFVLAAWVAWGLNPVLSQLEEKITWSRHSLVLWFLLGIALMLFSFFWLVIPSMIGELRGLGENWDMLLDSGIEVMALLQEELALFLQQDSTQMLEEWIASGLEQGKQLLSQFLSFLLVKAGDYALRLPAFVVSSLVFLLACYFLTAEFEGYQEKMKGHTSPRCHWWLTELGKSLSVAFGGYLKAQLILSLGVCLILLAGFIFMELRYSLLLAVIIGILDFIPMIGAGIVLIPWAFVAFILDTPEMMWQLLVIWFLTALFRRVLEPKVLGQQTGLSPLVSLMSIYVGLQVAGIWGMILAPAVVMVLGHFLSMGLLEGWKEDCRQVWNQIIKLFSSLS